MQSKNIEVQSGVSRPVKQGNRRPVALILMLVLLAGVALWRPFVHKSDSGGSDMDKLHGDGDEATGALSAKLPTLPKTERLPFLLKGIKDDSPGLRYAAADALGDEHGAGVADALESAFSDSASTVRQRALEVLPIVDPKRGYRMLLTGLADDDAWIREAAVNQLSLHAMKAPTITDRRAVPFLIPLLTDSDANLPSLASSLLDKLTGKKWHIRGTASASEKTLLTTKWQQWWATAKNDNPIAAEFADLRKIDPARMDNAPDFSIVDLDGNKRTLAMQKGHITLLNFWGSWCAPCQQEIPDLVRLDREYKTQGVDIIGIAIAEKSAESLRLYCKAHDVAYPQSLAKPEMQDAYGHIEEVPVTVLIDTQGRIRYRWEGDRDYATFRAGIVRLLREK